MPIKTARKMLLKLTTGQLRPRIQRRASATVYLGRLQGSSGHGIYVGRKPDGLFTILHGVRPRSREQLCWRIGKHIQLSIFVSFVEIYLIHNLDVLSVDVLKELNATLKCTFGVNLN